MSRYANVRGKRKPRNRNLMIEIITTAQRLYEETGGKDIDFEIAAARRQVERCERLADNPPSGRAEGALRTLNAAFRELRQTIRMRERKLDQCKEITAEAREAEELERLGAEAAKEAAAESTRKPELRPIPPAEPGEPSEQTPESAHDSATS